MRLLIIFLLIAISTGRGEASPDPSSELSAEQFNSLPRSIRIMYLKSAGNKLVDLGPTAKVSDLVDDIVRDVENTGSNHDRRNLAYALIAINNTKTGSELTEELCTKIANELIESGRFSVDGYEIHYHLSGLESAVILRQGLRDMSSYARIQIAKRFAHDIGSQADIPFLLEALDSEKNETVSKYLRDAIIAIQARESAKSDESQPHPRQNQGDAASRDKREMMYSQEGVSELAEEICVSTELRARRLMAERGLKAIQPRT